MRGGDVGDRSAAGGGDGRPGRAEPAERLPTHVDGEQPVLSLMFRGAPDDNGRIRAISWEHFFDRFDLLDLSFLGSEEVGLEWNEYRILYDPANLVEPTRDQ